jgi:prepilin-type processing-associated H-X9-DG protein
VANAAYLDGHVEAIKPPGVPYPSHWPAAAGEMARKAGLDYLSDTSVPTYRPR